MKKKLNKKGFTLVELLVVLVLLAVIMTIAIPSVTSSIERSKDKQKNSKIELLVSAAELYADRHRNSIGNTVYIGNLICDGLITKEQAKNPKNEKSTICGYARNEGGTWTWQDQGDGTCNSATKYGFGINENVNCSDY